MRSPLKWMAIGLLGVLALSASASAADTSPNVVREKRAEVFNRPEFKSAELSDNWLKRALRDFFDWLNTLYDTARWLFWLILIACLVLLGAIVYHIVYAVRRAVAAGRVHGHADSGHAERILLSVGYRQEADRRADAGDYTEAVRFLFLSLVYRFDEEGRVSLHKAYTNREYLVLLGNRTPARAALSVMVDTLDDHWYGQRACERPQFEACLAIYERLLASM